MPHVVLGQPQVSSASTGWEARFWALAMRAVEIGTRPLPRRVRPALGRGIGDLAYRSLRRWREIALRNLALAYPEWSEAAVRRVARGCFRHLGKNVVEFLALSSQSPEQVRALVRVEGMEHLRAALASGEGAIITSAHYGNWELSAARVGCEIARVNVIGRLPNNAHVTCFITRIREPKGYTVIERERTMTPYLERLRRNELVCTLTDANNMTSDLFVPFFGRPAAVPRGAAVLALRSGRPVFPAFCHRQPDESHHLVIHPPLEPRAGRDIKRAVEEWMLTITAMIETRIREDPAQWLWIHDRWKRQPL
jgi:Kdo2-lipid IVA lauroyltransferase/acyltransferase